MSSKDDILEAAMALLMEHQEEESTDLSNVTVRKIAERAGVGIGAINYHYQSKQALLNEAVRQLMRAEANSWLEPSADKGSSPTVRLRNLLKRTSAIGARYPDLLELTVRYELEYGQFAVADIIVPLLRQHWEGARSESEIRLAAVQLVASIQIAFLRREEIARFTGYSIGSEAQMEQLVDLLIDNIVHDSTTE